MAAWVASFGVSFLNQCYALRPSVYAECQSTHLMLSQCAINPHWRHTMSHFCHTTTPMGFCIVHLVQRALERSNFCFVHCDALNTWTAWFRVALAMFGASVGLGPRLVRFVRRKVRERHIRSALGNGVVMPKEVN